MTAALFRAAAAALGLALAATTAAGCSTTQEATQKATQSAESASTSAASASSAAAPAAGKTTLYYPDEQSAMFSIEAPDNWTVGKIDAVGDFGSVESPDSSVLQFRAQTFGTEAEVQSEMNAIVDSTMGFLKDNYVDVTLEEPRTVTVDGQPGAQLAGSGKDKDGNAVEFLSAMIALGPTSLAEIWAAVFPEGTNDMDAASAILDSFKAAKAP